jgi:hypothetical protein
MKNQTKYLSIPLVCLALAALNQQVLTLHAQGTAFTYQGRLNNTGGPANGSYDFKFTLFATNISGSAVAGPVTNSAAAVSNGLFTAAIDLARASLTVAPTGWKSPCAPMAAAASTR